MAKNETMPIDTFAAIPAKNANGAAAQGSAMPTRAVKKPPTIITGIKGLSTRVAKGLMNETFPKYNSVSGMRNTVTPIDIPSRSRAQRKNQYFRNTGCRCKKKALTFGARVSMARVAAAESCRLTLEAAKGLGTAIKNRASPKELRESDFLPMARAR